MVPLNVPVMDERTFGKTPPERQIRPQPRLKYSPPAAIGRDYRGQCPMHYQPWSESECLASSSIFGHSPCGKKLDVGGLQIIEEKEQFAKACEVQWPYLACNERGVKPKKCPRGWLPITGKAFSCRPDAASYTGPCREPVNLSLFTSAQLEIWAMR